MLKWSDLISLISSMVNRSPGGPSRERTHKTSCDGTSGWLDAPGPSQPGVSLRPHQSEQTRQGPDAVTGTGWLVSLGSSFWDLHPSCVNHDSKHTQDYQHSGILETSTQIWFNFLTISQSSRWLSEWEMDTEPSTDKRLLISLKLLLKCYQTQVHFLTFL